MSIASYHQQVSAMTSSPLAALQNPAALREQLPGLAAFGWFIWPA